MFDLYDEYMITFMEFDKEDLYFDNYDDAEEAFEELMELGVEIHQFFHKVYAVNTVMGEVEEIDCEVYYTYNDECRDTLI